METSVELQNVNSIPYKLMENNDESLILKLDSNYDLTPDIWILSNNVYKYFLCCKSFRNIKGKCRFISIVFGLIVPMLIIIVYWVTCFIALEFRESFKTSLENNLFVFIIKSIIQLTTMICVILSNIYVTTMKYSSYPAQYFTLKMVMDSPKHYIIFMYINWITIMLFIISSTVFYMCLVLKDTNYIRVLQILYNMVYWVVWYVIATIFIQTVTYGLLSVKHVLTRLQNMKSTEYYETILECMNTYNYEYKIFKEISRIPSYLVWSFVMSVWVTDFLNTLSTVSWYKLSTVSTFIYYWSGTSRIIGIILFLYFTCEHTRHYRKIIKIIQYEIASSHSNNSDLKTIRLLTSFKESLLLNEYNGNIFHIEISYQKILEISIVYGAFRVFMLYVTNILRI